MRRTLLVDNHDSYTFNLYHLLAQLDDCDPIVVLNDDPRLLRQDQLVDKIVISPGPGHPARPTDVGLLPDLVARTRLPVLGVCLGHQLLAQLTGASVSSAPVPRHGHRSLIRHTGSPLFTAIPQDFRAVRYHSLCVRPPFPAQIEPIAWAEDGVLMAFQHGERPWWGVQFHPESAGSQYGRQLLANFHAMSAGGQGARQRSSVGANDPPRPRPKPTTEELQVTFAQVKTTATAEGLYIELYGSAPTSFWLDSSRSDSESSRYSFLGDGGGPLNETLIHRLGAEPSVELHHDGVIALQVGDIFDVLEGRLAARRVAEHRLPFDFIGGYVGYFGYELKAALGFVTSHSADTPDSMWTFVSRFVAVDHVAGQVFIVAAYDDASRKGAEAWVQTTADRIQCFVPPSEELSGWCGPSDPTTYLLVDQEHYVGSIKECQKELRDGESYEICLTTKLRVPFAGDDLLLYRRLRRVNPAPYACYLSFGSMKVFCSSPERFLRIDRTGRAESRPIKGTVRRDVDPLLDGQLAQELRHGNKTQAENLMIIDLVRNDLGRVCEVGSVVVDRYMDVETYATLHQLVSTISGQLRADVPPSQCVQTCFPAGSMTGAPKERTMEIIDRLETEARGIYSGAIGYFSLNGASDLAIAIRTAVRLGDELTIGAGGAIVLDSDPEEEFAEMLLKACATLRAVEHPSPGA